MTRAVPASGATATLLPGAGLVVAVAAVAVPPGAVVAVVPRVGEAAVVAPAGGAGCGACAYV